MIVAVQWGWYDVCFGPFIVPEDEAFFRLLLKHCSEFQEEPQQVSDSDRYFYRSNTSAFTSIDCCCEQNMTLWLDKASKTIMLQVDGEIYLRGKIQDELIIHLLSNPKLWWRRLYQPSPPSESYHHGGLCIFASLLSAYLHLKHIIWCMGSEEYANILKQFVIYAFHFTRFTEEYD